LNFIMTTLTALSLGSNLGNRELNIAMMERELRLMLAVVRSSPLMETEPVGVGGPQPPYLNKIIAGYYGGTPGALLIACQTIELRLGRARKGPKAPRTADIEILLFGDLEIDEDTLTIPHPQMLNRRFCLEGLVEIDPNIIIPGKGTARKLYKDMCAEVSAQNVSFI
jgi:2-amino-4-hydroxy-6-hydroxymethyldihydropteridine diphosphokinase